MGKKSLNDIYNKTKNALIKKTNEKHRNIVQILTPVELNQDGRSE